MSRTFIDAPFFPRRLLLQQAREVTMPVVAGALDGHAFRHYGSFGAVDGNPAAEAPVETAFSAFFEGNPGAEAEVATTFGSPIEVAIDPAQIQIIEGLGLGGAFDTVLSNLCRTGAAPCELLQSKQAKARCRAVFVSTCGAVGVPVPGAPTTPASQQALLFQQQAQQQLLMQQQARQRRNQLLTFGGIGIAAVVALVLFLR